jgi:phage minor structural protein GP20
MDLLQYLISILGEEDGKKAYEKINKDTNNTLLVQNKKEPTYVDKKLYDEVTEDNKNLKKVNKKHEDDLAGLKKDLKDHETLQEKITTLEQENKTAKETYEREKEEIKYNYELNAAIEKSGAKNSKAIMGMIDKDKIKLVNDTLVGLDEQLKGLKETDAYLFNDEGNPGGTGSINGQRIDTLNNPGSSKDGNSATGNKFVDALLAEKKAEKESSDGLDNFFK